MTTEPSAEDVTFATIRGLAERAMLTTVEAKPGSHAAGYRAACRDVLAVLAMHGAPPGEPVIFSP